MAMGEHSGNYNGKDQTYYPSPQEQAQSQLEQLLAQLSQPSDFSSQLDAIYGPQEQALALQQQQAMQRAAQGDNKLAGMYRGLQGEIKGQGKGIDKRYSTAKGQTNQAYQQGIQGIGNVYNEGQSQLQAMASRLGLDAALPSVLGRSNADEHMLQGLLTATNQSAQNLLTTNNQSAQDYNTAQVGITGLAGAEARANLQQSLQNTIAQLQQQGLGIESQRGQSLLQLQQQDEQQRMQMQNDLLKSIQGGQNGGLDPLQQQTLQQKQLDMLGPGGQIYYAAAQQFGPDKASAAVNLINKVGATESYSNSFGFLQAVANANAQLAQNGQALPNDQLLSLAMMMYNQMHGGTNLGGGAQDYQSIINGSGMGG